MGKLLCFIGLFFLSLALPTTRAWAVSYQLDFRVNDLVSVSGRNPSPESTISGTIQFEADSVNAAINTITAIDLNIYNYEYNLSNIGSSAFGAWNSVGGVNNGTWDTPNTVGSQTNDFWVRWDRYSLEPTDFFYTSENISGIWQSTKFDNFSITEVNQSKDSQVYALFVGADSANNLRADTMASILYEQFSIIDNTNVTLLTDEDQAITQFLLKDEIDRIANEMNDNDVFFLYIAGHGTESIVAGNESSVTENNELIWLNDIYFDPYLLTDDELTDYLQVFGDKSKWVVLDACRSGGFVGSGEDLESLSNLYFLASAPEDGSMHYAQFGSINFFDGTGSVLDGLYLADGLPAFGVILADAFHNLQADADGNGSISFEELKLWMLARDTFYVPHNGGLVDVLSLVQLYEGNFGDPILYEPGLYNPIFYKSADARGDLFMSTAPVPEPSTFILLGAGLAGLAVWRRKRS